MKEKRNGLIAQGKEYSDGKSLLRDYISEERAVGMYHLQCLRSGVPDQYRPS